MLFKEPSTPVTKTTASEFQKVFGAMSDTALYEPVAITSDTASTERPATIVMTENVTIDAPYWAHPRQTITPTTVASAASIAHRHKRPPRACPSPIRRTVS